MRVLDRSRSPSIASTMSRTRVLCCDPEEVDDCEGSTNGSCGGAVPSGAYSMVLLRSPGGEPSMFCGGESSFAMSKRTGPF